MQVFLLPGRTGAEWLMRESAGWLRGWVFHRTNGEDDDIDDRLIEHRQAVRICCIERITVRHGQLLDQGTRCFVTASAAAQGCTGESFSLKKRFVPLVR